MTRCSLLQYYDDAAGILRSIILSAVAPHRLSMQHSPMPNFSVTPDVGWWKRNFAAVLPVACTCTRNLCAAPLLRTRHAHAPVLLAPYLPKTPRGC